MPGGDRTGPVGYGPRTGGGRGYCATGAGPVSESESGVVYGRGRGGIPRGGGRGFGFGGGRGFGRRFMNYVRSDYKPNAGSGEGFGSKIMSKLEEIANSIKDIGK